MTLVEATLQFIFILTFDLSCVIYITITIAREKKKRWYRKKIYDEFHTYTFGKLERMQLDTNRWSKIANWIQSCLSTPHSIHLLHLKDISAKTNEQKLLRQYLCSDYFSAHPTPKFTKENSDEFPYCLLANNKVYCRAYNYDLLAVPNGKNAFYCMNVNKIESMKKTADDKAFTGFAMGQMPSDKEFTKLLALWKENNVKICVTLGSWAGITATTPHWKTYGFNVLEEKHSPNGYTITLLQGMDDPRFQVMNFWFKDWPLPDAEPDKYDKVGEYVYAVILGMHLLEKPYVVLVHCYDGVHRSGFFVGILLAERMIEMTEIVNVPGIIYHLRRNRNPYCFPTVKHQELLFQLIVDYQLKYGKFATNVPSISLPKLNKVVDVVDRGDESVSLSIENEQESSVNPVTVKSITVNKIPTFKITRKGKNKNKLVSLSQQTTTIGTNTATSRLFDHINILPPSPS